MRGQIGTRLFGGICIVLGFTFSAPVDEAPVEPGGDYDDLVELFLEFRELQKVKITDWIPDYTPLPWKRSAAAFWTFNVG